MTRPTPNKVRDARDTLNSPVATEAEQDAAARVMERHLLADARARDLIERHTSASQANTTAPARIGWLGWAMILGAAVALAIVGGSAFGAGMYEAETMTGPYGLGRTP